jgi:hypothetical protein
MDLHVANKIEGTDIYVSTYEAAGVTTHLRHPSADKDVEVRALPSQHHNIVSECIGQRESKAEK